MVPDLSNWHNEASEYEMSDANYLNDVKQNSRLHKEVLEKHKPSDIHTINAIAENSYLRGLNKFAVYREYNWYWIAGGLASILFVLSLLLFTETNTHHPHSNASIIANPHKVSQGNIIADAEISNSSTIPINNKGVVIAGHETDEDKTVDEKNNIISDHTNNLSDDDTEMKEKTDDDGVNNENDKTPDALDDYQNNSTSDKSSDNSTKLKYTGFKTTGSHTSNSNKRNPDLAINISSVRVEQMQNLAVYLNSMQNKTKVVNGQLQNSSGSQSSVDYSPDDMPAYPGGNDRLEEDLKYLVAKHSFGEKYDENVSAMVSFNIDPKGRMDDIKIYSHKTQEIRKAITNALHELDPWSRGKKIGKKGSVHYEILLSFK